MKQNTYKPACTRLYGKSIRKTLCVAALISVTAVLAEGLFPSREHLVFASSPARSACWERIFTRQIAHPLTYAGFVSVERGITVGVHGLVYHTEDAGLSWKESLNMSACRHGLEIIDTAHAWHCGNRSVRRSVDAGKTWTESADFGEAEPLHARFISFADPMYGIIATDVNAALTADGGLSWKRIALPAEISEIAAVSASHAAGGDAGSNHGIILRLMDDKGIIRISRDRCVSWDEAPSPAKGLNPVIMADAPTSAMRFNDHGEGLIALFSGSVNTSRARVFRTTDGGMTWTEERFPSCAPGTLFISPDLSVITYIPEMKRSLAVYTVTRRIIDGSSR